MADTTDTVPVRIVEERITTSPGRHGTIRRLWFKEHGLAVCIHDGSLIIWDGWWSLHAGATLVSVIEVSRSLLEAALTCQAAEKVFAEKQAIVEALLNG